MNKQYSSEAKNIVRMIEQNADPVYGDGFRKVKSKFDNSRLVELLDFLKSNKYL